MHQKLAPIHPGEILLEEFIKPLGITQYRLAIDIHVPPRRINEIVLGNSLTIEVKILHISPGIRKTVERTNH